MGLKAVRRWIDLTLRTVSILATLAAGAAALAGLKAGLSAPTLAQGPWQVETIGNGIKPAIAVGADGTVHVAYLREAIPAATYYATNKSGEWVSRTAAEGYFYGPVDIAAGPDGAAYIAYHDHEGDNFSPAKGSGVVLTVADGTIDETRIDHPGHDQWDTDIAAAADGVWHVAGIDPAQFGRTDGVEYATNAFGGVRVENVGSGPQAYEFGLSIERAADGRIGIAYHDSNAEDLVYAERAPGPDGSWTVTVVDAEGRAGRYADLAFDAGGRPHISYWVFDDATAGRVRYARRGDDGAWTSEDAGALANLSDGFAGARKSTAIELDGAGVPHIVYGDADEIVYAIRGGGDWSRQTVVRRGDDPLGQLVEFALGPDERAHIVFFEATGTEPGLPSLAGRVRYATRDPN